MPFLEIVAVVAVLKRVAESAVNGELHALVEFTQMLYGSLEDFPENTSSWMILANRSLFIVESLAGANCESNSFDEQVKRIRYFHEQIHVYFQENVAKKHRVTRVFGAFKIRSKIKEFSEELEDLWKDVMLVLSINMFNKLDETAMQKAVSQDEAREQALLDHISNMIRNNNATILEELGIRLNQPEWKTRQITDALQRIMLDEAAIKTGVTTRTVAPLLRMIQSQSSVSRSMKIEDWRIDPSHVKKDSGDLIGRGGFGEVYKALYFGTPVAVKELFCTISEREMAEFRREIGIWHKLKHPHVLQLLGACDTAEKPFMISPYMSSGTLCTYVSDPHNLRSVQQKLRILYEVGCGMAYLHANHIIHGDIKPKNVLLDANLHAVISDFGMSRTKHTSSSGNAAHCGGTWPYMAPEMVDWTKPLGSSKKTDVYAYGITFYEVIINGGDVWVTEDGQPMHYNTFRDQVIAGIRPKRHVQIPDDIWCFMEDCWHQDPKHRSLFEDVLPRIQRLLLSAECSSDQVPWTPASSNKVRCSPFPFDEISCKITSAQRSQVTAPFSASADSWTLADEMSRSSVTAPLSASDSSCTFIPSVASEYSSRMVLEPIDPMSMSPGPPGTSSPSSSLNPGVRSNLDTIYQLAWLRFSGVGVEQSYQEALKHWKLVMTESNDTMLRNISTYMVGLCLYLGVGTELDLAAGRKLIIDSRNCGFQLAGGWPLEWNCGKSIDDFQSLSGVSIAFFKNVSFGSEKNSLLKLLEGVCYFFGFGTRKDQKKAVQIYKTLAKSGFADAQCALGRCYVNGNGLRQNYAKAFEWYRMAAIQGHAGAQSNLGTCYYNRRGVSQDYTKAAFWYRAAADQGNASAQNSLGLLYLRGHGVHKDYGKAFEWFCKAADQEHAGAQCNLGMCYERGHCVLQDLVKASEWYQKAAEQGDADANAALKKITPKVIPTMTRISSDSWRVSL